MFLEFFTQIFYYFITFLYFQKKKGSDDDDDFDFDPDEVSKEYVPRATTGRARNTVKYTFSEDEDEDF